MLAGVFFLASSVILRWYLTWVAATGYTYGALAAPIAFLLFTFFLGFAVVLGAEFNATVQQFWPARATRLEQWRIWLAEQSARDPSPDSGPVTNLTRRLTSSTTIRLSDLIRPGDRQPESWPIDGKPAESDAAPDDRPAPHDDTAPHDPASHDDKAGGSEVPPAQTELPPVEAVSPSSPAARPSPESPDAAADDGVFHQVSQSPLRKPS